MDVTHFQRTFNRFELKYLVPQRSFPSFVSAIDPYVRLDPHCAEPWGYPIYSVYWDSPGRALFWEKIEGLKQRRKLRFRNYGDPEHVFVEIKQRIDRTLQKRRGRTTLAEAEALFDARRHHGPDASDPEDPVLAEALVMRHRYRLRPSMAISYRRRAYFAHYEPDLRITFDRRVQYLHSHLDMSRPFEKGRDLVDPRLLIMEIKFSDRVPVWLGKWVRLFGFQMVRFSKYCTAVDRAHYGGELT